MIRAYKGGTKKATHKSTLSYWKKYLSVKESLPSRCLSLLYDASVCKLFTFQFACAGLKHQTITKYFAQSLHKHKFSTSTLASAWQRFGLTFHHEFLHARHVVNVDFNVY